MRAWPGLRAGAWLLGRLLRAHPTAVAVLALALGWTLIQSLSEIGITSELRRPRGFFYELAFLALAVAGSLGVWILGRHEWLWGAASRGQRAAAEAGFLLAGGALALGLAWSPAVVSGADLPWGAGGAALLHVGALAWLVTRAPTSHGVRPLLFVSLIWGIPPLFAGEPEPLASLGRWLGGPLEFTSAAGTQTRMPGPVDTTPAVACALAAWLLTPRTPRS